MSETVSTGVRVAALIGTVRDATCPRLTLQSMARSEELWRALR